MEIAVVLIVCAVIGAAILSPHNKAGLGCVAGGCLGPLGIIAAWVERSNLDRQANLQREEIRVAELRALAAASATPRLGEASEVREERRCPFCAERILIQAKVCKHCGRDVVPSSSGS
jgi:DNA-directed RNA polymerase subunit RPC12/RpoP